MFFVLHRCPRIGFCYGVEEEKNQLSINAVFCNSNALNSILFYLKVGQMIILQLNKNSTKLKVLYSNLL